MTRLEPDGGSRPDHQVLLPLMLCAMTAQALLVVLTPSVAAVATEFGVDVTAAAQARTVTAAVATVAAVGLLVKVTALGVRRIAVGGVVLTVVTAVAVSSAGGLAHYLAAHVALGMAVAALLTAGYAGLGGLAPAARRAAAGWVTASAGSAWVIGTPLVGLMSEHLSWRAAVFFPLLPALGVLLAIRNTVAPRAAELHHGALASLAARAEARRWVIAEALANVGWASVLTYVGALFVVGLGTGDGLAGWLLSIGAACFVVASVNGRSVAAGMDLQRLVAGLTGLLAVAALLLFGAPLLAEPWATAAGTVAFAVTATVAGLRIPATATLGMAQHPDRPDVMMAARTVCQQAGYLLGTALTGATIAAAGWAAAGPVLALVLVASAGITLRLTVHRAPHETP